MLVKKTACHLIVSYHGTISISIIQCVNMSRSLDVSNFPGSISWPRGRKLGFSKLLEVSSEPRPAQVCRATCLQLGSERGGGRG